MSRAVKLIVVLLATLLTLSLGQTRLRVASTDGYEATLNAVAAAFEAENPDIDVTVTVAPVDQYTVATRTQLTTGNGPDVFFVLPGSGGAMSVRPVAEAGFLADLSDQDWVAQVPEGFINGISYNGQAVVYPVGQAIIGMVYNPALFEAAGASVPTTWSELLGLCDTFNDADITPIALGAQTPWIAQLLNYAFLPSTLYAANPEYNEQRFNKETSFAETEGWLESMRKNIELLERDCFNSSPNGTSFNQMLELLVQEEAAMAPFITAALPALTGQAGEGQTFSMFAVPAVEDSEAVWIPAAPLASFGVYAQSRNLDAAKDFVAFLTRPESVNLFAENNGDVPIIPSEGYEPNPITEDMTPFIEAGKSTVFMDQAWPNPEVQQVHIAMMQEIFAGRTTPEEALEQMDNAFSRE